jgi:hypothetical protein
MQNEELRMQNGEPFCILLYILNSSKVLIPAVPRFGAPKDERNPYERLSPCERFFVGNRYG